jgi:release factor glutamine methyltransferase
MIDREMNWLLEEKYHGEKSQAFFADCKRLALGEPLAYLIGWSNFLGCKITLNSHPLIPRVETEFWVENAIAAIKATNHKAPIVLDLCAGSGCIGVSVAKAIPNSQVDFSEIDQNHLPTILNNLKENEIAVSRSKIAHTNLFEAFAGTKYDFILSNPPYINAELNRTDDSVVKHEPYISLFGGKDGMEIITKIIESAPQYLNPGGQLWIEHEPEQSAKIKELGNYNSFSTTTHKDQYGVERYSVLVLQ